ncbi:MAG TPA: ribonuclease HI family protein [Candidatus Dependentiae bacterium]|nr:ribonuclease HI family protein [Candidatus Dependentiae bacterium]
MHNIKNNNEGHLFELFVDGASRNNPGRAGVGIFITKDKNTIEQLGFYIGIKTNNQAEYLALLLGILYLKNHVGPNDMVLIVSDSELMVKQLKGEYRVKNQDLLQLYMIAKKMLASLNYKVVHVMREENCMADSLANLGIDRTILVPDSILAKLHEYSISL